MKAAGADLGDTSCSLLLPHPPPPFCGLMASIRGIAKWDSLGFLTAWQPKGS